MRAQAFIVSFVLAFLLFAVQPMATKMVLPTLGGTPAVWNTVMFTFQLLLLAGYCYAHLLTRCLKVRGQMLVHGALMLVTCVFLPLAVSLTTSDAMVNNPIFYLLKAFLLQLGLPFFCLAATAPLLQSWVSRSAHPLSRTPYVLYSASNLGSFAGLFGYVGIVEPLLDLHQQSMGWSVLYVSGMLALMLTGRRLRPAELQRAEDIETVAPDWRARMGWMWLAFLPSSLSLGITTYITTDVGSLPLLWVIPLSLYLLSFVDAFRTRPVLVPLCQRFAPILGLATLMLYGTGAGAFLGGYLLQLLTFAMLALAVHGWLALKQPATRYLTQFYVCLSIGGALGGVLNGLVAPLVFRSAFEYPIVLLLSTLTAFILLQRREDMLVTICRHLRMLGEVVGITFVLTALCYALLNEGPSLLPLNSLTLMESASFAGLLTLLLYRRYVRAFYSCVAVILVMLFALDNGVVGYKTLFKDRNFFGVSRVYENPKQNVRYFVHDTTMHGEQSLDKKEALDPLSYYGVLREFFDTLPVMHRHPMAMIGLGVGTVKCYAQPHQKVDFYEINPMVKMLAEDPAYFTYMQDCKGEAQVLLGDGRVRLAESDKKYGVIMIDAFSSDAIPSHLLTREALTMYLDKLAPNGVLVMHTTNRHIDLWPLLGAQVTQLGVVGYGKFFEIPKEQARQLSSYWVVIARSEKDVAPLVKGRKGWQKLPDEGNRPWTDQYINLLPYFKDLK